MSTFLKFSLSVSKVQTKNPDEIISQAECSGKIHKPGIQLYRTQILSNRLIYIIKEIYDVIPMTAGGPQATLQRNYDCFNYIFSSMKKMIEDSDMELSDDLKCLPQVDSIQEDISKFGEFLPNLTSSMAPTYQNYIPQIQEDLMKSSNKIQDLVDKLNKAKVTLEKKYEPLDLKKYPNAQIGISMISVMTSLIADLTFLMTREQVKQANYDEKLQSWINKIEKAIDILHSNLDQPSYKIVEGLQILSQSNTSLMFFLDSMENFCSNFEEFISACVNLIVFLQLYFKLQTDETIKSTIEIVKQIGVNYSKKQNLKNYLQTLRTLAAIINAKISDNYFSFSSNIKLAFATLKALLNVFENENYESQAIIALTVCRIYAVTIGNYEGAEKILTQISLEISKIIKDLFDKAVKSASLVYKVYNSDLFSFNEKLLGQLNYHISQIQSIQSIDITSNFFIQTLRRAFDSIGSLPFNINNVIEQCTNEKIKGILKIEYDNLVEISKCFTKWTNELLLTLSSCAQIKGEVTFGSLTYLSSIGKELPNEVADSINTIGKIIQSSSHYIFMDISESIKLIESLNIIQTNSINILSIISGYENSNIYPLLSILFKAFKIYTTDFDSPTNQLSNYLIFEEIEEFVSSMTALLCQLIPMISELHDKFKEMKELFTYFFSKPYSLINTACAIIKKNPTFVGNLMNFPNTAKAILEVVWPVARDVTMGNKHVDANDLIIYTNTLPKLLNDTLNNVLSMPQPCDNITITPELQELKKFGKISQSLSPELKYYSLLLIDWVKDTKNKIYFPFVKQWFNAIYNPSNDYIGECQKLLVNSRKLLSKQSEVDQVIDSFCYFSVSMATHENAYGEIYAPLIKKQHTSMLQTIHSLISDSKHANRLILKIISNIVQIISISNYSSIKPSEIQSVLFQEYKNVALILKKVIENIKSVKLILMSIQAISQLLTLFFVAQTIEKSDYSEVENNVFKPILTALMNKKANQEFLEKSIIVISQKLWELSPNISNEIKTIDNVDVICDKIYEKVELFRKAGNNILKQSVVKEITHDELVEILNSYIISSLESSILSNYSIELKNLKNTSISISFVEYISNVFATLNEFSLKALSIFQTTESLNLALRSQNRNIARELDNFINFVENPQEQEETKDPFQILKQNVFASLSDLFINISQSIIVLCKSKFIEMFQTKDPNIQLNLKESFNKYTLLVNELKSKAVGLNTMELSIIIVQIDSLVNKFNSEYEKLSNITDDAILSILEIVQNLGDVAKKFVQIYPSIIDTIQFDPDPVTASNIPEHFELPPMVDCDLTSIYAYNELLNYKQDYDKVCEEFISSFNDKNSSSDKLFSAVENLIKSSKTFAVFSLQIVAVSYDKHLQLELQANIHQYSAIIDNILSAAKNRLLRKQNFENDMEEALQSFKLQIAKIIEIAESISKSDENITEIEEIDDVSRELSVTSKAIEEMTTRLAKFNVQVPIIGEEIIEEEENHEEEIQELEKILTDLETEQGTFPSFVISHATPILQTTSKILKRAQEITQSIIQNEGFIQNEKSLIKVAQDLSESAELLLIVAEILIHGEEKEAEYKVIAAAKIIKASISSLVTQVLANGGDSEGIMNTFVGTIAFHTNKIIHKATKIIKENYAKEDAKEKNKAHNNIMIEKLNIQNKINEYQKLLQKEESLLKQFRRRF